MIPPLTAEEYARLVPDWAKRLHALDIPHVVGLLVCDVLYWDKYGPESGWLVTAAEDGHLPCHCCQHVTQQFLSVKREGSTCGSLGAYYVADVRTEVGRAHVLTWATTHNVSTEGIL